ncbi:zinc finger protein 431-like isoform X2 [Periplaneta americana]|uniref:zinc finger protein 431-like isoform X2 n=1 Tax=Periplaneta americana TaxID=6978 RepID=UPI0037E8B223
MLQMMMMENEEERIAKLHRTLHSLATRIPRIVLQQVEEVFPALKDSTGINIGMSTSSIYATEGVKKVECKQCSNVMTVSGECEQCHKLTPADDALMQPERPFSCDTCTKTFMRQEGLTRHKRIQHGQFVYTCQLCKGMFQNKTEFISHRRGCTKEDEASYSCDLCKREFTCVNSLRGHECKQKMFSCSECDKTYHTAGDLQKHSLVHSTANFFTCEMCDKTYHTADDLQKHSLVHSTANFFTCEMCDKTYHTADDLQKHSLVHSTANFFTCEMCDKTYHTADDLQKHSLVHSTANFFTCEMCDKSFAEKKDLTSHNCKKSSEPQYLCRLCNRAFVSINSVKTHQCAYFTS